MSIDSSSSLSERPNGIKHWYPNGFHWVEDPEIKGDTRDKERHLDKSHRVDDPEIKWDVVWYINRKFRRVNGPAYESANGDKAWCLNGKFHRVDGPAIEW